jgi:hypothetical protein
VLGNRTDIYFMYFSFDLVEPGNPNFVSAAGSVVFESLIK